MTFDIHDLCFRLHVVALYTLGDILDIFYFLFGTWVAILGLTKTSNKVEVVATSLDVLEVVETSFGEPMYFNHGDREGDN
jgi:hypothetical protein